MSDPDPQPAVADEGSFPDGRLLIYQDGTLCVHVRIDGKTIWLTQRLMTELYQVTVANINQHLKAINYPHQRWG